MTAQASSASRPLAAPGNLKLAIPIRVVKDIGDVIAQPDARELISGVTIEAGKIWPDDRGFFTELFRFQAGESTRADVIASGFQGHIQVSAAFSWPGVIKALHYHVHQCDLWAPVSGNLQAVLVDLRLESPTFGRVNTLYVGEWRAWRVRIPAGVGHGYKVVGDKPAVIVYATDRFYDSADEGRIAFDNTDLKYDWELRHK